MSKRGTKIEWAEEVWNPVIGCTPVSPGCLNCYAAKEANRFQFNPKAKDYAPRLSETEEDQAGNARTIRIAEVRGGRAVFTGDVRTLEHRLTQPLHWKKPCVVFVNSMSDLFHEAVPVEFIDRVFAVMSMCPQHTFVVLTKRAERMVEYQSRRQISRAWQPSVRFGDGGSDAGKWKTPCDSVYAIVRAHPGHERAPLLWPLPNVHLGVSVENQECADRRVPALVELSRLGWKTVVSQEPQVGPVEYRDVWAGSIGGIICGGESGSNARPFDVAWARQTRDWAERCGVKFFLKQLGRHVVCRNDRVAEWLDECKIALDDIETDGVAMQGDLVRVHLKDLKGSDPAEWPEDLRGLQDASRLPWAMTTTTEGSKA